MLIYCLGDLLQITPMLPGYTSAEPPTGQFYLDPNGTEKALDDRSIARTKQSQMHQSGPQLVDRQPIRASRFQRSIGRVEIF